MKTAKAALALGLSLFLFFTGINLFSLLMMQPSTLAFVVGLVGCFLSGYFSFALGIYLLGKIYDF